MFSIPVRPDLELRLATYGYAEEVFALIERNREHLAEWLPWVDGSRSAVDVVEWIRLGLDQMARNEGWRAVLWYQGRAAGAIGFKPVDWTNLRVEIGYWLSADLEGRGLMTDAVRVATDYAFEEWKLNRVEIRCAVGNHRSAAVARRSGFTEEGVLRQAFRVRDTYHDLRLFSILRQEWKPQTSKLPGH